MYILRYFKYRNVKTSTIYQLYFNSTEVSIFFIVKLKDVIINIGKTR